MYLNGLALQKFPPESEDEFLPVIKIAQLRAGNTVGADRASARLKPEYIVHDGDVLFSWSGSLEVEFWCGGDGALNQHLFKVSSAEVPKWFYYLATRHFLHGFREIAAHKATTMGHIQRKHLTEARLLVTPAARTASWPLRLRIMYIFCESMAYRRFLVFRGWFCRIRQGERISAGHKKNLGQVLPS